MRRTAAIVLALSLLVVAAGEASASRHRKDRPDDPSFLRPEGARQPPGGAAFATLAILALGGFLVLVAGLALAWWARRPREIHPPRRTFASGRRLAMRDPPLDEEAALAALPTMPVGTVVETRRVAAGRVAVAVQRKRGQPCEQVGGFLAGLFEAAWASDVRVVHDRCSGKDRKLPCWYTVERAPVAAVRRAVGPTGSASGA